MARTCNCKHLIIKDKSINKMNTEEHLPPSATCRLKKDKPAFYIPLILDAYKKQTGNTAPGDDCHWFYNPEVSCDLCLGFEEGSPVRIPAT